MCWSPQKDVVYEFDLNSAMSSKSCSPYFDGEMGGGVSGCTAAILWSAVTRICSEQPTVSFCSSHLVFFSMHCTKVQVVQPHNNTDTATAWRNLCFIFSERSYFHMVNNPSIAVDVFPMHMMTSLLVDELLLPVM